MRQLCCATVSIHSPRGKPLILLFTSLLLLHGATTASADAPSSDYKATIDAAVAEYADGHWEESLALFARAHALSPSARTLRGLGLCSFEMRRYSDAINYLSSALTDPRKPLTNEQLRDTSALVYRAQAFVARVRVLVSPLTASLSLDGRALEVGDNRTLLLDPGAHQLIASAQGYEPAVRNVEWSPGSEAELELRLVAEQQSELPKRQESAPPLPPPVAPQTESKTPTHRLTTITYATLVGAVNSLALAGTSAYMREHRARQLDQQCQGYEPAEEQRCGEMLKSGRVWLALAISSGALSGILTAVTIGLWRARSSDDSASARALDACQIDAKHGSSIRCSIRF